MDKLSMRKDELSNAYWHQGELYAFRARRIAPAKVKRNGWELVVKHVTVTAGVRHTAADPHTHDRETCPDCARQRQRWGADDHCGRTHDFQTGQVVTIGAGTAPWTVAYTYGALVVVARPVKGRFSTKRRHLSFGDRQRRPIADLHLMTEVVTT